MARGRKAKIGTVDPPLSDTQVKVPQDLTPSMRASNTPPASAPESNGSKALASQAHHGDSKAMEATSGVQSKPEKVRKQRRKPQATTATNPPNNIQPKTAQQSTIVTSSHDSPLTPCKNSIAVINPENQTASGDPKVSTPKVSVPNMPRASRRQREKAKASTASTLQVETQPQKSQKSVKATPPFTPRASAQQGVASSTTANHPVLGVSKALKPTKSVPNVPKSSWKQRQKANADAPSSAAPSISIQKEPTPTTVVARIVPESSQNLKPNADVAKVSETPIVQSQKKQKNANWKTAWMTRDAGEVIQTIPSNSLVVATATVSSEFGFEDLCSYNWQENGSIVVPGGPPKWVYQPLPITLLPDAGHQFVDQNAFRVPQFPFEPAFQALSIVKPEAKLDDIDIIVNRNSLRKLLDFAAGRRRDPWRMDLHLVKNTLFISRKEMSARAMVRGNGNSGYGHNFEKAFTKPEPGLDGSSSHHRVIRYRFGSLECAVRFEVDAYYEDPDLPDPTDPAQQSLDQIATTMAQLQINEPQPSTTKKGNTQVIVKGNPVDPAKLAEIKTRKQVNINDALPQLWFGRTPYLLTGRHENGVFGSISCSHVQLQFKAWETDNQEALRKMVTLLTDLKRIVQGMDRGAAILTVLDKGGPLQIFKMKNATGVLPKHMITKYWTFGSEG